MEYKFTADNFIVGLISMPSQQSDAVQNNDHSWAQAGGFSVGKSYNTQSGTAFAYLVKR